MSHSPAVRAAGSVDLLPIRLSGRVETTAQAETTAVPLVATMLAVDAVAAANSPVVVTAQAASVAPTVAVVNAADMIAIAATAVPHAEVKAARQGKAADAAGMTAAAVVLHAEVKAARQGKAADVADMTAAAAVPHVEAKVDAVDKPKAVRVGVKVKEADADGPGR
ncbi:hypothetical protein D1872_83380 [compost metagenome]